MFKTVSILLLFITYVSSFGFMYDGMDKTEVMVNVKMDIDVVDLLSRDLIVSNKILRFGSDMGNFKIYIPYGVRGDVDKNEVGIFFNLFFQTFPLIDVNTHINYWLKWEYMTRTYGRVKDNLPKYKQKYDVLTFEEKIFINTMIEVFQFVEILQHFLNTKRYDVIPNLYQGPTLDVITDDYTFRYSYKVINDKYKHMIYTPAGMFTYTSDNNTDIDSIVEHVQSIEIYTDSDLSLDLLTINPNPDIWFKYRKLILYMLKSKPNTYRDMYNIDSEPCL